MMDLKDLAAEFATLTFEDVYSTATFNASVRVFGEMTASGPTTARRIMETDADTVIPARRVVRESGTDQIYIVGMPQPDYWEGEVDRIKYTIIPAPSSPISVGTAAQFLADTILVDDVYAEFLPIRREVAELEMSDYYRGFEAFMSSAESISRGLILKAGSTYYRSTMQTAVDATGFSTLELIGLEDPVQTVIYTPKTTYDPETDQYGDGTGVSIPAFKEVGYFSYQFTTYRFQKNLPGDVVFTILVSDIASPKAGDDIDGYQILAVNPLGVTANICHCRPV